MIKKILMIFTVCFYPFIMIQGQWTKEDSLWLKKALNSRDEIHLNSETMKAIQSGTLINFGKSIANPLPLIAPSELPITRKFENIATQENINHWIGIDEIDPYLYFKYYFKLAMQPLPEEPKPIPGFDFRGVDFKTYPLTKQNPIGGPMLSNPRNGGASVGIGAKITTDFNAILSNAFLPSYRQRMHNLKYATAWKTYNRGDSIKDHPRDSVPPLPTPTP